MASPLSLVASDSRAGLVAVAAVEVLEVVERYYPRNQIPAKTQFFLEELFEK